MEARSVPQSTRSPGDTDFRDVSVGAGSRCVATLEMILLFLVDELYLDTIVMNIVEKCVHTRIG
jgi:hypothetical protein